MNGPNKLILHYTRLESLAREGQTLWLIGVGVRYPRWDRNILRKLFVVKGPNFQNVNKIIVKSFVNQGPHSQHFIFLVA
jgi:hypothetical protein